MPIVARYAKDCLADDVNNLFENIVHEGGDVPIIPVGRCPLGQKRRDMTNALELMGVQRPMGAIRNSRA